MLKNKNIILTGASSGIGAEICKLISEDNTVFAVSRNISKIVDHPNVIKFSCDISKGENVDVLFKEAFEQLGDIDVFMANAGFAYYEYFDKADWGHIESIFKTNVFSILYSLAKMKEIKEEAAFNFVITASAMSLNAMPGYALYSGTKFALKGFTDAFRFELSKNQCINMVYPIETLTSFFDVAGSEKLPWPRQKASTVAKIIVNGVSCNKKHIYPSKLYRLMSIFDIFLPIMRIYLRNEAKKLKQLKENYYAKEA